MALAEHFAVVGLTTTASIIHTIHACRLLRRFPAQLRRYTVRNDHLLLVTMGPEPPSATTSSWPTCLRKARRNQARRITTTEER